MQHEMCTMMVMQWEVGKSIGRSPDLANQKNNNGLCLKRVRIEDSDWKGVEK